MLRVRTLLISYCLFGCLLFAGIDSASAQGLQAVVDVSLYAARAEESDGVLTASFTAVNNDLAPLSVTYGIRAQTKSGDLLYEEIFNETHTLNSNIPTYTQLVATKPINTTEPYEVFIVAKSAYGLVLALTGAGTIAPTTRDIATTAPALGVCTQMDASQTFRCTFDTLPPPAQRATYAVRYVLYRGSVYGSQEYTGSVALSELQNDNSILIDLSDQRLTAGRYEILFSVESTDATAVPSRQQNAIVTIPGQWVAFDSVTTQSIYGTSMDVSLRLDGSEQGADRRLLYWLLNDDPQHPDEICASGDVDIARMPPRTLSLNVPFEGNCVTAHFVGILFNGRDETGNAIVADTYGDADFDALLARTHEWQLTTTTAIVLILSILIPLVAFVVYRRRTPGSAAGVMVALALPILVGVSPSVVHATTFLSADTTDTQFIVNMSQPVFATGEDITFTLGFLDTTTGQKPTDGSISVSVDGGVATEIVNATDTATFYFASVPGVATEGTHTLSFASPDLCGGVLDVSLFYSARWDIYDCEFEVEVEVENTPDAPYPPSITSDETCATGTPFEMAVRSVHPLGLDVYYNIDWDADGSIDERVPAAGYVAHDVPMPITHTWNDTVNLRAQAVDSVATESIWNTYNTVCGPVAGGTPVLTITATPTLVAYDGSATIAWNTTDAYSCTVTSNGYNWSGESGSEVAANITEALRFTLSCFDAYGTIFTDFVRVWPRPTWQEI